MELEDRFSLIRVCLHILIVYIFWYC